MMLDTSLTLCLIEDGAAPRRGVLKMQNSNGVISMSFFPETEGRRPAPIPSCIFQLCDFTMIEVDASDRLILTLSGARLKTCFYFMCDNDVNTFLQYIAARVKLKPNDMNPRFCMLEPLDISASFVSPFSVTTLPPQSSRKSLIPTPLTEPSETKTLSFDEYEALFDSDGRFADMSNFPGFFYNKDIELTILCDLLPMLLKPKYASMTRDERIEVRKRKRSKYTEVKMQWSTISRSQWHNHVQLRQLVSHLESRLEEESAVYEGFPHPRCVQRVGFNVLLTFFFWNWDASEFADSLVGFICPCLEAFVKDATDTSVITPRGETVDINEAEADIFWCFSIFYDRHLEDLVRPSNQPYLTRLFLAAGDILSESFPNVLQILTPKHAKSLDFLRDDCARWFANCFSPPEVRRLWISVWAFPSAFQFFQCFIVSMLVLLMPSLSEMNPLNTEEFVRRFQVIKHGMDLNTLLNGTRRLLAELTKRNGIESEA